MADIYDERVEGAITELIHGHQARKQAAERKMALAQSALAGADQAIGHIEFALSDYRRAHGLPARSNSPSPVLWAEYSHMGPVQLVEYWADKQRGLVVVRELARIAVGAGVYPNLRLAASAIYMVLKRKPFDRVAPGRFQRKLSPGTYQPKNRPARERSNPDPSNRKISRRASSP